MSKPLRILIVDDSNDDAKLLAWHMEKEGLAFDCLRVDKMDAIQEALTCQRWNVVLCDYYMPGLDPHAVLSAVRRAAPDIPIIVVSGQVGEEALVDLMKAGARDIVLKNNLQRLVPAIKRELKDSSRRREQRKAEERLWDALDSVSEAFVLYDADDRLVLCNETYKKFYPKTADLMVPGTHYEDLVRIGLERGQYESWAGRIEDQVAQRIARHRQCDGPFEQKLIGGRWVLVNERRTRDGGTVSIRTDITERKVAEQALSESENFIHTVLDNVADAVVTIDEEFKIRSFNASAEQCFGFSSDEVMGRHIKMLAPRSEQRKKYLTRYLEAVYNGDYAGGTWEVVGLKRGGTTFPMELTVAMTSVSGRPMLIGSVRDLTQKKNAERALGESEERFRRAFETAPHGMALVGLDGRWLKVNSALCQLVGYEESELFTMKFQDITHPDDIEADLRLMEELLAGEISSYQMEKRYIDKSGATVWVLLSVSLVQDSVGKPQHVVAQILDLTKRKDAEAQLVQAQKMEAVGQLTGGIAHDFNNLLTVILGNCRLLERNLKNAPAHLTQLSAISTAAKRGAAMTERLLAFSRKDVQERKVVDAARVIADMRQMLGYTLGEVVKIDTSLVGGDKFWIQVDPNQLEAAILNLATNARDAMEAGGTISIGLEHVDTRSVAASVRDGHAYNGQVLLTVSDTGVGIPSDNVSRIFEPFFTTKDVGRGSGLGLSMVFGFVNSADGHIRVESEIGRGTTFRLYFPRTDPPAVNETNAADAKVAGNAPIDAKVLVVEDEPGVRDIALTLLQELGCEVIAAKDGPSALALLQDHPDVDLLFTDVVMPGGMTGIDLAERARVIIPRLRVLYTTGYADEETATADALRNPDSVVRKPYEDSELIGKVQAKLQA